MKKAELEHLLMDSESSKRLLERAQGIKARRGRVDDLPRSKVAPVQPSAERAPTPDEMRTNDRDHSELTRAVPDVDRFIPELQGKSAKEALGALIQRYASTKTEASLVLLVAAVNRLTNMGELDVQTEALVTKAHDVIGGHIFARFYQHSDFRGRSLYVVHNGDRFRYRRVRYSALESADLNDQISSLFMDAGADEAGGYAILFQNSHFEGRYRRFGTTPGDPTRANWISYVGDFINDRTSSILLVRRSAGANELAPIALGDAGLRDQIATYASSFPRASLRGEPIVTWDMWPNGPRGDYWHPSEPNKRFVWVRVPVEIDVPYWFDYDAEVQYWIYLYVNTAGDLRGYASHWGYWIEGGVKSDDIAERLDDALPDTLSAINDKLDDALSLANALGPFSGQYFLPGVGDAAGRTNDDVSLILVRR